MTKDPVCGMELDENSSKLPWNMKAKRIISASWSVERSLVKIQKVKLALNQK